MAHKWIGDHDKFNHRSQNTLYGIRYIHGQMSYPTSQIIVQHILRATRACRPPHHNGILSSVGNTKWIGIIFH